MIHERSVAVQAPPIPGVTSLANQAVARERFFYLPFFDHIRRADFGEHINPRNPWAYFTMEIYRQDIKGQGGLGMLASDTLRVAEKLNIPMVCITPFYTSERLQVFSGFTQDFKPKEVKPTDPEKGFGKVMQVSFKTNVHDRVPLDVYAKREGSVTLYAIHEPDFGELYQGKNNDDHRLYQEVALGFGGYEVLTQLDVEPAVWQLNEAATVFSAIARLDDALVAAKGNMDGALDRVRANTIYTNHTLVQAAEAVFTKEQFEHFVIPNIDDWKIHTWLRGLFDSNDTIRLSTIALELSGKRNGVSQLHALKSSNEYRDAHHNRVEFIGVTNGISLDRWGDPDLLALYRRNGVIDDQYDLPTHDFAKRIQDLDFNRLEEIKDAARERLRVYLRTRTNHRGNAVEIPQGAHIINWRRRIEEYKRPGMLFNDITRLANFLEDNDMYVVMAGRAHPANEEMRKSLQALFEKIDRNQILQRRFHFVENYDEPLARHLVQGADISINTPQVGKEACGTSWEKDILNNGILISTDDGGVADLTTRAQKEGRHIDTPYLRMSGSLEQEEVTSLYQQLEKAAALLDPREKVGKERYLKAQLTAYLPIISGSRMMADYLTLAFPA